MQVVCTIVDNREFIKIKNFIKTTDPKAFVSVTDVFETLGDGFKTF